MNRTRQAFFAMSVLALLAAGTPIWAKSDSDQSPSVRGEARQEMREIKKEVRVERTEKRQEVRNTVAENHANRLERRFAAYVERLGNIIERLEKYVARLKEEGKDVAIIEGKLDATKLTVANAQKNGADAIAQFRAIEPEKYSEQRDDAMQARDLAVQARREFAAALKSVQEIIRLLKALS